MKKILFFIDSIYKGGAERVLSVVSKFLVRDYIIEICYFNEFDKFYEFDEKINITKLPKIEHKNKFLQKFSHISQINKKIKSSNPDVIISFMDFTNFDVILANFFLKKPLIVTEHVNHTLLNSKKWTYIRNFLYKFASGLSVLTKDDFNYYKKFVKNVKILPNPVDLKPIGLNKENIIILPARLEPIKDHKTFLNALRLIDKELLKNWRVLIIGDGSMKEELFRLSDGLNVEFLGATNRLDKIYEVAKILVLPSINEGFSNVLVESMFFKIARISSKSAGGCELIRNGENGLLFEISDELDLASKIEYLLLNEDEIKKLADIAYKERKEFSIEVIGLKWEEFIKEVINEKK